MQPLEQAVLDLVRLGLKGDTASVRTYAARLLRREPKADGSESGFRETLSRLLLDAGAAHRLARGAPRDVEPETLGAGLPLVSVEHAIDAQPPVLMPEVAAAVRALLDERHRPERLARQGVEPTRTLLLTGAPGVGKTMTARFIAHELGLPLLTIDLAALMSSFLGKTGQNLRQALDHARRQPCVLLLDEFDALGKRRDDPTDVGELKRIVNVLLLELERWPSFSLLVGATNHPELLDRAVWRRFELVLALPVPDATARRELLARLAAQFGLSAGPSDLALCARATAGASPADITAVVRDAARGSALAGDDDIPGASRALTDALAFRLRREAGSREEARVAYCGLAREHWGWSQRQIAAQLDVSHVTVGKLLRTWDATGERTQTRAGARPRK